MEKSSTSVSLKLLIDTKSNRVLFAEASKDFIDFLFNLLRFPIGTATKLINKNDMVGCIGKLYESIENFSDTYLLHPNQDKDALLKPRAVIPSLLLPENDDNNDDKSVPPKLYMCRNRCNYNVTEVVNTTCPICRNVMNNAVAYVGKKATEVTQSSGEGGYVKGVVTYMVMDDLVVQPLSTISSITLLNKFNIKDVSSLRERDVNMGIEEGIKLLKASLQTNHALTSVFLKNMEETLNGELILS